MKWKSPPFLPASTLMPSRFRLHLSWQILLAGILGWAASALLGRLGVSPLGEVFRQGCDWAGALFLAWTRALAAPVIVSSIVLGVGNLEAMRGLGRLVGRMAAWIAGGSLLAALVGLGAALFVRSSLPGPEGAMEWQGFEPLNGQHLLLSYHSLGWLGLVLLGLGFGFYRNQIDEGLAKPLWRLCRTMDELLAPLLEKTFRLAPVAVFALLAAASAPHLARAGQRDEVTLEVTACALAIGWAFYGLAVLPGWLWLRTRIQPWKYLAALAPAIFTALASGSPQAALPLTLDGARRHAGISNRVAGATLPLGAAMGREGMALGWMTVVICLGAWPDFRRAHDFLFVAGLILAAGLTGCGADELTVGAGVLRMWVASGEGISGTDLLLVTALERLVTMGGAAVSVISHACAAAVIAHGEGERGIPAPLPPKDPFAFDETAPDALADS